MFSNTSSIKAGNVWPSLKFTQYSTEMMILSFIFFFISSRGLFSHIIHECPKSKFDQKSSLNEVKNTLNAKGFVLISGKDMKHLLIQHGAREEDMAVLESGYIHKHLPADQQAAMYHRLVNE